MKTQTELQAEVDAFLASNPHLRDTPPTPRAPPALPPVESFRSQEQVVEAMSSERYRRDPAYREDVAARLAVSTL